MQSRKGDLRQYPETTGRTYRQYNYTIDSLLSLGLGFASYSCKFSEYEYSSFGKNTKRIRNKACLYVVLVRRVTRSLYVHLRKFTSAYKRFVSCPGKKNDYEYLDIREKTRISEYKTNMNPISTYPNTCSSRIGSTAGYSTTETGYVRVSWARG